MQRSVISAVAAASVLALATPAVAGGMAEPMAAPAPAPVMAPAPMMAGADWTGFYAGAQLGFGRVDSPAFGGEEDGAVYGVHAGYLYDLGSFVLGGEVDYDVADIEGAGLELDSVLRAKAIAGYDAGAFMPYLTAGVARANTSGALELEDTGQFAGLGVAYQFSDSIRMGGEILAHRFDDFDDTGLDVDATTATLRVSFSF